jgi:hypothetical protein
MNRYFPIFHGLHERAPWGIAVERPGARAGDPKTETPRVELLLLCRTEKEAKAHAERASLGQSMKDFRDQKIAESEAARAGRKAP